MQHRYSEYQDTPLWRTIAAAVAELQASRDIALATAPEYVIGYLCQQLALRKVVSSDALSYDPQ